MLTDVCLPASWQTTTGQAVNETSFPAQTNSTNRDCSCTGAAPAATAVPAFPPSSAAAPALGLLTVRWESNCVGDVDLMLYHPSNSSSPVCHQSETKVKSVLVNVCEDRRGCRGKPQWHEGRNTASGYYIKESGAEEGTRCDTLRVLCKGRSTGCSCHQLLLSKLYRD